MAPLDKVSQVSRNGLMLTANERLDLLTGDSVWVTPQRLHDLRVELARYGPERLERFC
ncbi:hypothetical protein NKG95_29060 [Mesorhizobium sp. M1423]|uniref:hypothetical protein n=1 Tax=Mesorhizobium sp. M1423 TaxID=2957101 RepID=UPI0033381CB7